jgi:hypothetical protein
MSNDWRALQQLEDQRVDIVTQRVVALMKELGIYKSNDRYEKLFDAIKQYME